MANSTSRRLRAARELRGFARRAGSPTAGPAVLDALHGVVAYDCAQLTRWDPAHCQHATIAAVGYPRSALQLMDGRMHIDPLFDQVYRDRVQRLRDIPDHRRRGESFEEVIGPLGFVDGLTQCLFARDGRYLGMLNMSTLDRRQPDDDAVALLELLADDLATVLDPLPALTSPTGALAHGDTDGLLVTSRAVTPLSPGARPELACPTAPLRPALDRALANGPPPLPCLVLLDDEVLAVSIHGTAGRVVVLHRTEPPPFGLTPRELTTLDALSRGHTNAEIAANLRIAPRTVATHIEHILAKTGAPNRAGAARFAAQLGLLV